MSEKRKPTLIMLLRIPGKKTRKIEIFNASDFRHKQFDAVRYRIRVNGKWYGEKGKRKTLMSIWEFRDILWQSVKKMV